MLASFLYIRDISSMQKHLTYPGYIQLKNGRNGNMKFDTSYDVTNLCDTDPNQVCEIFLIKTLSQQLNVKN